MTQFILICFIIIGQLSTVASHAGAPNAAEDSGEKPDLAKSGLIPTISHRSLRKPIPGVGRKNVLSSSDPDGTPSLTVDKDLKISLPKLQAPVSKNEFLFQPYSQDFIFQNISMVQVSLEHLEEVVKRLEFTKSSFLKTLRLNIQIGHYRSLLTHHPIVQLKESALTPLLNLEEHEEDWLIQKIQLQPVDRLTELKNYLLHRPFEDNFILEGLYSKIDKHLEYESLAENSDLLEWVRQQRSMAQNKDARWTYFHFLDRSPNEIFQGLRTYLEALIHENLNQALEFGSKTYLQEAEKLLNSLKILSPNGALQRESQLEIEFSRLQFESYLDYPEVYNRLMEVYPKLDGASTFFSQSPKRAMVFFHFFDQLLNHGSARFQRGELECREPTLNREACLLSWQESVQFLQYVARNSPFSLHSRKAVDYLQIIQKHKKLEFPLLSRSLLLELMDFRKKPYP